MRADVAIIGAGAMGSAALWRLAERGVAALAIEQFAPGHDQGSSHGESRIIRSAYYEGPHYVPLVLRAFELWRELEAATRTELLTITGTLMIGHPEGELVDGALASARAHDLPHELLDAGALRRRFPQFRPAGYEVGLFEAQAGVLRPEAAIQAMAGRAEQLGARVIAGQAVTAIRTQGDGVVVEVGDEQVHARRAVLTAGAWLPALLPRFAPLLQVERQVFAWFPTDGDAFGPGRFPAFMHEIARGRFRYGLPTPDGRTVKLGVHHEGALTAADTLDRAVHDSDLAPIQEYIRHSMIGVRETAERSQVCMYTNTPDHHFIVDSPPELPGVTVVSACSGHGFKFAPALGEAVADLITTGSTAYPIAPFSLARFA